jgi:hypothetical protein
MRLRICVQQALCDLVTEFGLLSRPMLESTNAAVSSNRTAPRMTTINRPHQHIIRPMHLQRQDAMRHQQDRARKISSADVLSFAPVTPSTPLSPIKGWCHQIQRL